MKGWKQSQKESDIHVSESAASCLRDAAFLFSTKNPIFPHMAITADIAKLYASATRQTRDFFVPLFSIHIPCCPGCRSPPLQSVLPQPKQIGGFQLPKGKFDPDYHAIYPDITISNEVLNALHDSDLKMKYAEYDLKSEQFIVDTEGCSTMFIPSREDSLERLIEMDKQFQDESPTAEDRYTALVERQELHRCLQLLNEDEYDLIRALFIEGQTEKAYGEIIGITQQGVSRRKMVILLKLKKYLNF